jgi:hypothetical protein
VGKRALVIRDAAIGDLLMATPAIHELAEDGYEVHVACKRVPGEAVLENNPHVARLHQFEACADNVARKAAVAELVERVKPDRWHDLAFTCEGQFLYHSDRIEYYLRDSMRRMMAGSMPFEDAFGGGGVAMTRGSAACHSRGLSPSGPVTPRAAHSARSISRQPMPELNANGG